MKHHNINIRRPVAKLLAASIALTQLTTAYAASTDISDIPLAVKSSVPPNIMFMIDNSGSMQNIVPDAPYDKDAAYLNCPATAQLDPITIPAGSTVDLRIVSSGPRIRYSGTNYVLGLTAGQNPVQRCFDSNATYSARLNADNGDRPGTYLDAQYAGNYLNWYFAAGNTTPVWSSGQQKKPQTQSRLEIAQIASKAVVDSLNNVRIGLSTYNNGSGGTLLAPMSDISNNRAAVKTKIDALSADGNTPLSETLSDIGRYFALRGTNSNLTPHPEQTNPSTATISSIFNSRRFPNTDESTTAPIQYFCQKSFAVLMTDGRPQGDRSISSILRDYTGDCAAGKCDANPTPEDNNAANNIPSTTLTTTTYKNGTKVGSNYEPFGSDYLDDVAAGLFDMDLRPDLVKPIPIGTTPKAKNNLITYPIGFADDQVINDPLLKAAADKGQGVEKDKGLYLTATNAATLVAAFQAAADDILGKDRGASAVAVANANVSDQDDNNQSFASSYNAGSWTGDLQAYPIDLTTGQPDQSQPTWRTGCADWTAKVDLSDPNSPPKGCSAQEQLNERTSPRMVVTYSGNSGTSQGLQFRPYGVSGPGIVTTVTSAQHALLNTPVSPPGTNDAPAVIAFLRRGDLLNQPVAYRSRNRTLGDIVNAEPVIVNKPKANYSDAGYAAFRAQHAATVGVPNSGRTRMVYQGANDGMLHAFNAATGVEQWAYIPNLVIPNLNNLSRRSGFAHKFYVDGTPTSGDVDFNNVGINGTGTSDWHTILVGGLAKGGRGFYALDVTDPIVTDEAAVAGKVLWEFPNSATSATVKANIGYSFGKPVIVKIKIGAVATWVVLVTSGYDNGSNVSPSDGTGGDGGGYLFVLDAKTGDLIQAVPTSVSGTNVGTSATPSGLAQISAYVDNTDVNNITTTAYGGDLNGNLWRFNLAGVKTGWNATRLAILKDPSGTTQPVTTVPELANIKDPVTGIYKRFVYVGTGQYLGDKDPLDSNGDMTKENSHTRQRQTMYGLVDDGSTTIDGRATLIQQTISENSAKQRTYTQYPVTTQKGWYIDLPITGERSVTDPQLALGALVFTTNIPVSTPCVPGGTSYLNVVDYKTGGNIDLRDPITNALIPSGSYLGDALASRGVLIKLPDVNGASGAVKALIRRSDGTTTTANVPVPVGALSGKRVSWREIPDR